MQQRLQQQQQQQQQQALMQQAMLQQQQQQMYHPAMLAATMSQVKSFIHAKNFFILLISILTILKHEMTSDFIGYTHL